MLLPTYDVFDEARYFRPGERETLCTMRGKSVALTICEDAWNDRHFWKQRLYQRDPVEEMFAAGGEILICINASPYNMGKREMRRGVYRASARRYQTAGGIREPGGRERPTGVRRVQFRDERRGRGDRVGARPSKKTWCWPTRMRHGRTSRRFHRRMRSCVSGAGARNARLHAEVRV